MQSSAPHAASETAQKQPSKPPLPAAGEKPSGGSFKDRIAAFNKPAAPPIVPFNPNGSASSAGFIKKPFVAPPPSKNAYIPQPREQPQKIYRREEDPEITDRLNHDHPAVDRPLVSAEPTDEPAEDQPKPTSLKERIALLQKQQLEQVARHGEAVQKKEKPKKPPKKRAEHHVPSEPADPGQGGELERTETAETARRLPAEGTHDNDGG